VSHFIRCWWLYLL